MSKKVIIFSSVAVVLVIALSAGFIVFNCDKKNSANTASSTVVAPTNTPVSEPAASPTAEPSNVKQASRYVGYSEADFAKTDGTKLLFFHALWCPQCKALDSDITKNISSDSGVTIYKVDYDSNQALRQKYGVNLQTTVVKVDSSGNLVKKYVAYNEPTYANLKANLF